MKKLTLILAILITLPNVAFAGRFATVVHPVWGDKKVVMVGDPHAFDGGYKLVTKDALIGGKVFRPSSFSTTLASNLAEGGSETTLKVNSITLKDGTSLADSNYGSFLILTVGTGDNEEKIAVSSLNAGTKTFTVISRGLEYGRWASSTANMRQHLPGERVFVSDDDHFLYQKFQDLETAETISGQKTFSVSPILPTPTSSNLTYGANVEYVNNVATSGAANLSTTVKGIGQEATKAQAAAGTASGSTGARLLLSSAIATSSRDIATTSVVVTQTTGYINQTFLDTTLAGYNPTGAITAYASTTAPSGWLLCDGSSVSTTTYSSLFAIIGYTYGGSAGTFKVPDIRGRQITMASTTLGIGAITATGGATSTIMSETQMPSHNHTMTLNAVGLGSAGTNISGSNNAGSTGTGTTNNTGGSAPLGLMDPYIVMNYIIKY